MFRYRSLTIAVAALSLVAACGSASPSTESAAESRALATLPAVQADVASADDTVPSAPSVAATTDDRAAPTPRAFPLPELQTVELDQPAVWPASDTVFATPEEAAESFVSTVLGVDPVLGEFAAGDSRSGEIQVFSPGDNGSDDADLLERGLLGLRIIGPNDGWFVIGAGSQGVSIDTPETLDPVPASTLVVAGEGRGFEGTIVVTAFRAGDADDVLDQVITSGGAFADLEPYSVTLDLSGAAPGDVIALLVRGDTGLGGDPGDFASLPIVISQALPQVS